MWITVWADSLVVQQVHISQWFSLETFHNPGKVSISVCVADTSPLEVLVDRASKRLYEMFAIGEHVTLKVTSHGTRYGVFV